MSNFIQFVFVVVCKEEIAVMLLTTPSSGSELCDWLREACGEVLCSCADRAYLSLETVVGALSTVIRVYHLLAGAGHRAGTEAKECIEKMTHKFSPSVSDYVMRIITQVRGGYLLPV